MYAIPSGLSTACPPRADFFAGSRNIPDAALYRAPWFTGPDPEGDRQLAAIVARANRGYAKRRNAEYQTWQRTEADRILCESFARAEQIAQSDPMAAAGFLLTLDELAAERARHGGRLGPAGHDPQYPPPKAVTPGVTVAILGIDGGESPGSTPPLSLQYSNSNTRAPLPLYGPVDEGRRPEWLATIHQFHDPGKPHPACGRIPVSQECGDEHREVYATCKNYDCATCGPALRARWVMHLAALMEEQPMFLAPVIAPDEWTAFARRVQRAKGRYIRVLDGDGRFGVLTTVATLGTPVPDPRAALVAMLAAAPRRTTGGAHRVGTSRVWGLALAKREADRAAPPEPIPVPVADAPLPLRKWRTVGMCGIRFERLCEMLSAAGVPYEVRSAPGGDIAVHYRANAEAMARIWGENWREVRRERRTRRAA